MSEDNVELMTRALAHFESTGDILDELIAPDFVWDMSTFHGWPEQQLYEGLQGARQFLSDWTSSFEEWQLETEGIYDAGADKVLIVMRQRARSKTTGMPVDMRLAQVYTLRDGQQVRMQMYADVDEARNAVGLRE